MQIQSVDYNNGGQLNNQFPKRRNIFQGKSKGSRNVSMDVQEPHQIEMEFTTINN
jgi:hypothetical protein